MLRAMVTHFTIDELDAVAAAVRARTPRRPQIALILGSGLSSLSNAMRDAQVIPFSALPKFPVATVVGHAGELVVGELAGRNVMIMKGRIHFYEGYSMAEVTLPIRVMQRLGIQLLIVTNAAGAVNPEFAPGDVMLITDQLNLLGMMGQNPLVGANYDEIGPRFPDMGQAYDRELCSLARQVAKAEGIALREGTYAGLSGPSFEGPAELRFLRVAGADAVGMSTVHEVVVARHGGMRVLGFSGISNKANLDGSTATTHEEVLAAGKTIAPKLERLITGVLRQM
jgi:purine-nucleoside phosphorylase